MDEFEMAKKTEYDGRCYDSLTEARWAAYFDAAGMPYQHQPETFEFLPIESNQTDLSRLCKPRRRVLYTPDFFLPEQDTYVEVKNGNFDFSAAHKIQRLAARTGKAGLVFDGRPGASVIFAFSPDEETAMEYSKLKNIFYNFSLPQYRIAGIESKNTQLTQAIRRLYGEVAVIGFTDASDELIAEARQQQDILRSQPTAI